jgi:hypothetical protein
MKRPVLNTLNEIQYRAFKMKFVVLSQFSQNSNKEDGPFTLDLDSLTVDLINPFHVADCLVNKLKRKRRDTFYVQNTFSVLLGFRM